MIMTVLFMQNLGIVEVLIVLLMLIIMLALIVVVVLLCIRLSRPRCIHCGSRDGYRLEHSEGITLKKCKRCNNVF